MGHGGGVFWVTPKTEPQEFLGALCLDQILLPSRPFSFRPQGLLGTEHIHLNVWEVHKTLSPKFIPSQGLSTCEQ